MNLIQILSMIWPSRIIRVRRSDVSCMASPSAVEGEWTRDRAELRQPRRQRSQARGGRLAFAARRDAKGEAGSRTGSARTPHFPKPWSTALSRGDAGEPGSNCACTGLIDEASVSREPFAQWVIEDRFKGPRPAWRSGAEIVGDVEAHERLKLHVLNACHSALAYLGSCGVIDWCVKRSPIRSCPVSSTPW